MEEVPIFRANKRRKYARQQDFQPQASSGLVEAEATQISNAEAEDEDVQVSELVKLRKSNRPRSFGVQFSQQRRNEDDEESSNSMALAEVDPVEERLKDMSNRFIGSTGQVVDVDKHMMAYIDSAMAKRDEVSIQNTHAQPPTQSLQNAHQGHNSEPAVTSSKFAAQPQLAEFDLGAEAHKKNLARTEAAIVRAQAGLPPPAEEIKPRRPRKPRLGRDGKPLRPRPRKQRNSEDIARDALVEQILHEHKVDAYDGEQQGGESDVHEEDEDADERLAEQFKQQFMDAMAERQQKNQIKAATAAKAKGIGPEQSGPKMGGSRSMRAKMAQMQQQGQQPKSTG